MKRCPRCSRTFDDERMKFCRADGSPLFTETSANEAPTTPFIASSFEKQKVRGHTRDLVKR
jgi:hypothetical protein